MSMGRKGRLHTAGTASLSACALAASVVTVLFAKAVFENAELLNGAARLVRNALENMMWLWRGEEIGEGVKRMEA